MLIYIFRFFWKGHLFQKGHILLHFVASILPHLLSWELSWTENIKRSLQRNISKRKILKEEPFSRKELFLSQEKKYFHLERKNYFHIKRNPFQEKNISISRKEINPPQEKLCSRSEIFYIKKRNILHQEKLLSRKDIIFSPEKK